jgi:carbamoylphosphate synthase large subunit
MRVWVVGAAYKGAEAIRQLRKNEDITIIVSDGSPNPKAVTDGVIEAVDYVETVTSANINTLARRIRPDLILIDSSAEGRNLGSMTGASNFTQALTNEMALSSEHPCLVL